MVNQRKKVLKKVFFCFRSDQDPDSQNCLELSESEVIAKKSKESFLSFLLFIPVTSLLHFNFFRLILPRYGWRVCPVSAPPLFSSPWTCWDLIFAALASKNTRKIPTLKKKNRFGFVVGQEIEKKNNHNDRAYNASFWFRASTSCF